MRSQKAYSKKKMTDIFIAGPCVIENEAVTEAVATELVRLNKLFGIDIIFKSSFDKANRTSLHSYRGPGLEKGLEILAGVKEKYGLRVLTDIHESWQAEPVGKSTIFSFGKHNKE